MSTRLILDPDDSGERYEIEPTEGAWIGRSSKCRVQLRDRPTNVSGQHARVFHHEGQWFMVDESRMGTSLNGAPLQPRYPQALDEGDAVAIGEHTFRVSFAEAAPVEPDSQAQVTLTNVNMASLDAGEMLLSAVDLAERLASTTTEAEVYRTATEYLARALDNSLVSAHAVIAPGSDDEAMVLLAAYHRLGEAEEPPLLSQRIVERACKAPDSVAFLHRQMSGADIDATVASSTRVVCACLIEYASSGRPILLYAVGDHAFASGENWVAGYLNLVATLTRQHIVTLRRVGLTKYFSPKVVELLMQRGGSDVAEGEPRVAPCTSLFFDLRGFSLSSEATAHDLLTLHGDLQKVMTIVTSEVFAAEGTVIDYQGDGCLAAWGVPFDQPDQAELAVRCALTILGHLREASFRVLQPGRAGGSGFCGIGIASGEVLAGSVGSKEQFKYGVLGPSVNLAARLEGLTKRDRMHAPILMTANVRAALPASDFLTRRLGTVQIAGMSTVERLYEAVEPDDGLGSAEDGERWHRILRDIEEARSDDDLDLVEQALTDWEMEHARLAWVRETCQRLREPGVLASWQGVLRYHDK